MSVMSPFARFRSEPGWYYDEDRHRFVNKISGEEISYIQAQDELHGRDMLRAESRFIHDSIERAMRRGPDSE